MPKAKNVLVTGSSSGIGLSTIIKLHDNGYNVIAHLRNPSQSQLVIKYATPVYADLNDNSMLELMMEEVADLTDGKLHGLFNNAAYGQPGALLDITPHFLQKQFQVNLFAQQLITNLSIPLMNEGSRIVFNSSVLGIAPAPMRGSYVASKFALEGLAATYRLELRKLGIHVSVIRPGPIDTRFKINSLRALDANVLHRSNHYKKEYELTTRRLLSYPSSNAISPDIVANKAFHAFSSTKPCNYYRATKNTYVAEIANRIIPSWLMDVVMADKY